MTYVDVEIGLWDKDAEEFLNYREVSVVNFKFHKALKATLYSPPEAATIEDIEIVWADSGKPLTAEEEKAWLTNANMTIIEKALWNELERRDDGCSE